MLAVVAMVTASGLGTVFRNLSGFAIPGLMFGLLRLMLGGVFRFLIQNLAGHGVDLVTVAQASGGNLRDPAAKKTKNTRKRSYGLQ